MVWATNGREALALLDNHRSFDLIFCEILMPEMDGMSLYEELRHRDHPATGRVVFLTGDPTREPTAAFLQECGRPCLLKPFAIHALRELLGELLPEQVKKTPA